MLSRALILVLFAFQISFVVFTPLLFAAPALFDFLPSCPIPCRSSIHWRLNSSLFAVLRLLPRYDSHLPVRGGLSCGWRGWATSAYSSLTTLHCWLLPLVAGPNMVHKVLVIKGSRHGLVVLHHLHWRRLWLDLDPPPLGELPTRSCMP